MTTAPRSVGLGEATMPAANAAALLRRNATDPTLRDRPAIRFGDATWTYRAYFDESARWADLFLAYGDRDRDRDPDPNSTQQRPLHVGVLLDNVPEYLFAFGGTALAGATLVGLNPTRVGEHLLRDITHTDCRLVVTEPRHLDALPAKGADLPCPVLVVGDTLDAALGDVATSDPGLDPDPATTWALIFTSGTSAAPKAVICTQRRLLQTGARLAMLMGVGPEDTGYVCMPLFHSNAVMVGWAPALTQGAAVALARRFSASGFLPDVRHYGATYFCYTGKPLAYLLATPEQPDDGDNPLQVAYGNEGSPHVVQTFARRFGVTVLDVFGATEGGVGVERVDDPPPGAVGRAPDHVKVVDDQGHERPRARFEVGTGRLLNAADCVGEIVNTAGVGVFEGYYANDDANRRATRFGWYWSGDLGYLDDDRLLYFAGRDAEWIRVDGENFPAGPIEAIVARHPTVHLVAVYGVPDVQAGDQVMACLALRDSTAFDPVEFAAWLDGQPDLGPKWRPRYVRITGAMPTTASNKIVKRTLVSQRFRADRTGADAVWVRDRGEDRYRRFTAADEDALRAGFVEQGRARFWDL